MRTLLVLVAISMAAAYDLTNQVSRTTGDIPAVLAVRSGHSYSATDNVVLRSQDVASILNSGNYVTFQGKEGDAAITYAAIPVIRNGNTYSVAQTTLAQTNVAQTNLGQRQTPAVTRTASATYGNRVAVPGTSRTETVTTTRVVPVQQAAQLVPSTRQEATLSVPLPTRNIGYSVAGAAVNSNAASFVQTSNPVIIDANRAQVSNAANFFATSSNSAINVGSSSNIVRDSSDQDFSAEIPGVAGVDYSVYASIPQTSFTCEAQSTNYGYYADQETICQVFHICQDNVRSSFLCPNGTRFDQQHFVCDWWYNVDCSQSSRFYSLNARFGVIPDTVNFPVTRTANAY